MNNKIKAGYRMTVVSWENDADHYKTIIKEGMSEAEVRFAVDVLSHMESKSNGGKERGMWGNWYEPSDDLIEEFALFFAEIIKQHAPVSYDAMQWEDDDIAALLAHEPNDDLAYYIGEYIAEFLGSGDFFTRVCSSIKIEFVPQDVLIEDVTARFVLA